MKNKIFDNLDNCCDYPAPRKIRVIIMEQYTLIDEQYIGFIQCTYCKISTGSIDAYSKDEVLRNLPKAWKDAIKNS